MREIKAGGFIEEFIHKIDSEGFEYATFHYCNIPDIAKEDKDLAEHLRNFKLSRRNIDTILKEEYGMEVY